MTTLGTKEWAEHNINFSKGCSNNCKYCYARRMANRFGWKERWVEMENKDEMAVKNFHLRSGVIMSPSSHDITETNIDLAIKVFKNILRPGNTLLIVSKPKLSLIQRICSELSEWKHQVLFRFTIGTNNDLIREYWEPGAPSITERLQSLEYAFNERWQTSVSVEPLLDENIHELIKQMLPLVTDTIWVGPMNKVHVPSELWTDKETILYSKESLLKIKKEVDKFHSSKIKYKDHFLKKIS